MQRHLRLSALVALLTLSACPPGDKPDDSGDTTPGDDTGETVGDAGAVEVLYLEDGPEDLDWSAEGDLLITTQYGGHVLSWTPGSKGTDTVERSIAGLEGIWVQGGERIWAAVSDGGMEGAVGWLEDSELVALATQVDDGTLFRSPRDVAIASDGTVVTVDATVGAIYRTDPDNGATSMQDVAISSPRRLLIVGETLWVGGGDGVYTMDVAGGELTRVDTREAWGLLEHEGRVLATNDDAKVFEVGGDSIGGAEIDRPGGMAVLDGTLYVSDLVGSYLWAMEP